MRTKAILIDIDGTLADSPQPSDEHRKSSGDICWMTWIRATQYSPVHPWCSDIVSAMSIMGYHVVYLTARGADPESKKITEDWLKRNSPVAIYELYMRDEEDTRPDKDQKQDVLVNKEAV